MVIKTKEDDLQFLAITKEDSARSGTDLNVSITLNQEFREVVRLYLILYSLALAKADRAEDL